MLSPVYKRGPRRLKKLRRRREPDEDPNKGRTQTSYYFTKYGINNHNARSCTILVVDPEAKKRKVFHYVHTLKTLLVLMPLMSY